MKKRKFVNSSTNTMGFISKAVREIYPSFRYKPAENCEHKQAIQVARRCYQSYIDNNLKAGLDEPTKKIVFSTWLWMYTHLFRGKHEFKYLNTYSIFNSARRNKIRCEIDFTQRQFNFTAFFFYCLLSILWRFHYFIYLLDLASFI